MALRRPLQHRVIPRRISYPLSVTLALQVLGDRVAGNVGRGRVVLNLQVAADLVVVDRQRGVIVVGLEIVADCVAGTGTWIGRADLDRAEIFLDHQIALDHGPTNDAPLQLAGRKHLDVQIVADRGSLKTEGTAARNCNITIHGASEGERATGYSDAVSYTHLTLPTIYSV